MSNPVFNRLETQWSGQGEVQTAQGYQQAQRPIYDQVAFDQARTAYQQPAADAVTMGRMTYDDVVVKTAGMLVIAVCTAAVAWFVSASNLSLAGPMILVGFIGGLIVAMINIFSKKIRPSLVMTYAALEGVGLGALSMLMNTIYPGIVVQAVVATFAVFGTTLALFASGKVRNSPKLQKFALISLIGLIASRLLIWLLAMLGVPMSGGNDLSIMGLPLGLLLSVFAVFIGAICLISDFDQVKVGVQQGAPAKYAWMCAFGIMVTLIWLYVEILNILSHLNSR